MSGAAEHVCGARFTFSDLGNSIKMLWFLRSLPTPTFIAHVKKSDIRGNFGCNQDETGPGVGKLCSHVSLFCSHGQKHLCALLRSETHPILQWTGPTASLSSGALDSCISSFPAYPVLLCAFWCLSIASPLYLSLGQYLLHSAMSRRCNRAEKCKPCIPIPLCHLETVDLISQFTHLSRDEGVT